MTKCDQPRERFTVNNMRCLAGARSVTKSGMILHTCCQRRLFITRRSDRSSTRSGGNRPLATTTRRSIILPVVRLPRPRNPSAVVVRPWHCWSRGRGTCARVRLRRGDKGLARRHRGVGPDRATGGTHPRGAGVATGAEAATEIGEAGAPTGGGTTAEGATGAVATTARITERTAGTTAEDREVAVDAAGDTAEDTTGRAGAPRGRRVGEAGDGADSTTPRTRSCAPKLWTTLISDD